MKLAIHGGEPVRQTKIYYGRQYIDQADCDAVNAVMLGDLITTGPRVKELEGRLCALCDVNYASAVANGTAALHAACYAAGIGPGDEVITTPMTFAASANCVLYCGGTPVFADIDPTTYNISPAAIREKITSRTKAIIAVDFTGQAADLAPIRKLCDEYGLVLIEDAAHSIGTKYNGIPVGSVADITTLSFHPVKTITGGEGGAVLTNSHTYYRRVDLFRTHCITRDVDDMHNKTEGSWYMEQLDLGYNYRLTDFQAALIVSQLDKLDRFAKRRKEIVRRYDEAFATVPGIILQKEIPQSDTVRHLYIIQLDPAVLNCTRRAFFDAMTAENVVPMVHYIPVYYHPYYQRLGYTKGLCPYAEALYENIMSIPLYYSLTDKDVDDTILAVKKVAAHYKKQMVE